MFAPLYIDTNQYNNGGTSSCAVVSPYTPVSETPDDTHTVDIQKLRMDSVFMALYKQNKLIAEQKAVNERIEKVCKSFIDNGGAQAGIVASKVFMNIAAELVDLPFSEILAQYSPSNEEIAFDLVFNKRIEVSIGKYLDDLDDDNVMFSLSVDDEPYAINSQDLYRLKNVLLEALAEQ